MVPWLGLALGGIGDFVRSIPLKIWIYLGLALTLYFTGHHFGAKGVEEKHAAALLRSYEAEQKMKRERDKLREQLAESMAKQTAKLEERVQSNVEGIEEHVKANPHPDACHVNDSDIELFSKLYQKK